MKIKRGDTVIAKKITLGVIFVASLAVIFSLVTNYYFNPSRVARRKFEAMARQYYEGYYYQDFINASGDGEAERVFSKYAEQGLAPVFLRQLLLYDKGRNQEQRKYFDGANLKCDTNSSTVTFLPRAPFGLKDYEMRINLTCKKP